MSYSVVEADLQKNREMILSIWKRNALAGSESRYSWIYLDNPTGPSAGWLVRNSAGGVVGSTGLAIRKMKENGHSVLAGQAIDLVVDKGHRTVGPAIKLQKNLFSYIRQRGISFVFAFSNQRSEAVLLKAGYKVLGNFERWTIPLRAEYRVRKYIRFGRAVKWVSTFIDGARKVFSNREDYKRPAGFKTEILKTCDIRFDRLWEKASNRFDYIGDRSSTYLNWRFRQSPELEYRIFSLLGANGELLAYLVYSIKEGFASIADILFENQEALDALLPEFVSRMRLEGVSSVSVNYLGSDRVTGKFRKNGFYKRSGKSKVLLYLNEDLIKDAAKILNKNRWHLTGGDKDV